ncbi:MAG: hypothetical protein ABJF86_10080 [Tateyamaria sp.]|uniref:hypothetical protein n=1 Tax=Tateyamaria sp. TaxID=1929288 RepID=UPI00327AA1B5
MSFAEAIAAQPAWIGIWLKVLFAGGFVLPLALFIWRETRLTALFAVLGNVVNMFGVQWLFAKLGYVKLLGLPHILMWGPLVVYLVVLARRPTTRVWPRRVIWVIVTILSISLAFDIVDVLRWILGERAAFELPA